MCVGEREKERDCVCLNSSSLTLMLIYGCEEEVEFPQPQCQPKLSNVAMPNSSRPSQMASETQVFRVLQLGITWHILTGVYQEGCLSAFYAKCIFRCILKLDQPTYLCIEGLKNPIFISAC